LVVPHNSRDEQPHRGYFLRKSQSFENDRTPISGKKVVILSVAKNPRISFEEL
jgi:hypothetical protein